MIRSATIVATAALALGCVHQYDGSVSLVPRARIEAADYDEILDRWTRHDRVYDILQTVLFVDATFHSPEFRVGFLARHRDIYGQGSEEARRLALTDEGAEEGLEFFISAWTPSDKNNDFEDADSIWRVTLEGDGGARVDGEVRRIKTSANVRIIYPYVTDFARTYAVRFPRTTPTGAAVLTGATRRLTLRLTSAAGEATLIWEMEPSSAAPPPQPAASSAPPPAPLPSPAPPSSPAPREAPVIGGPTSDPAEPELL